MANFLARAVPQMLGGYLQGRRAAAERQAADAWRQYGAQRELAQERKADARYAEALSREDAARAAAEARYLEQFADPEAIAAYAQSLGMDPALFAGMTKSGLAQLALQQRAEEAQYASPEELTQASTASGMDLSALGARVPRAVLQQLTLGRLQRNQELATPEQLRQVETRNGLQRGSLDGLGLTRAWAAGVIAMPREKTLADWLQLPALPTLQGPLGETTRPALDAGGAAPRLNAPRGDLATPAPAIGGEGTLTKYAPMPAYAQDPALVSPANQAKYYPRGMRAVGTVVPGSQASTVPGPEAMGESGTTGSPDVVQALLAALQQRPSLRLADIPLSELGQVAQAYNVAFPTPAPEPEPAMSSVAMIGPDGKWRIMHVPAEQAEAWKTISSNMSRDLRDAANADKVYRVQLQAGGPIVEMTAAQLAREGIWPYLLSSHGPRIVGNGPVPPAPVADFMLQAPPMTARGRAGGGGASRSAGGGGRQTSGATQAPAVAPDTSASALTRHYAQARQLGYLTETTTPEGRRIQRIADGAPQWMLEKERRLRREAQVPAMAPTRAAQRMNALNIARSVPNATSYALGQYLAEQRGYAADLIADVLREAKGTDAESARLIGEAARLLADGKGTYRGTSSIIEVVKMLRGGGQAPARGGAYAATREK